MFPFAFVVQVRTVFLKGLLNGFLTIRLFAAGQRKRQMFCVGSFQLFCFIVLLPQKMGTAVFLRFFVLVYGRCRF